MQAMNKFIEIHLPDKTETEAGLVVDAKGYFGPIARIESVGKKADCDDLKVGDWIVFDPSDGIIRSMRIKGVLKHFMYEHDIMSKMTNEEVDANYHPQKLIIDPKDAIEKLN